MDRGADTTRSDPSKTLTRKLVKELLRKVQLVDRGANTGRSDPSKTLRRKPDNTTLIDVTNRYVWRLVKNGSPSSKLNEIVYLDSPASAPSVFDADSQVFCLPALQDERHLWCLLLQATDGDHGIRYQRVGITKIQNIYEDHVNEITESPGDNPNPHGEYFWGSEVHVRNESTICII